MNLEDISLTDILNILEEVEEEEEKIKEEILQKQFESRTRNSQIIYNEEVIKDMCALSDIIKKEIIEDKKKSEKKFVETKKALKCTDKRKSLFVMGLLAKYLEKNGIVTAIEKNSSQNNLEEGNTILQFMVNGLGQKRKYNLHFDMGVERIGVLLDNKEEQDKFINKLRKKLSKEYNISEDDIIITNPKRGRRSFQFEKKNNWLSFNNSEGEWCIAYRGVGTVGNEIERNDENDYSYDDDIKHLGKKVGNGVYCSPNPKVMERYAEIIQKGKKKYKIGFMVRVNPEKIRVSARNTDIWIVDGKDDDIRPYRILVKEIKEIKEN